MRFQQKLLARFAPWIGACFILLLSFNVYIGTHTIQRSIEDSLQNITESIRVTIISSTKIYQDHLSSGVIVAEHFLEAGTRLSPEHSRSLEVENQITHEKLNVTIPIFEMLDDSGNWTDLPEKFANNLTDMVDGTITVFQVFEQGLLRISTNVRKEDGTFATATYIPRDSEVYRTISSGNPYRGMAYVVNDWYITSYNPIRNKDNKVIGALYVGVSQQDLEVLRDTIINFRSHDTYYSTVLDIHGNIIIHPIWQGKNIAEVKDAGLAEAFNEIIGKINANQSKEGRIDFESYGRRRINYYSYIPNTNWIVLSGVDARIVERPVHKYLIYNFLVVIVVLAGLMTVIWSLSKSVARPIHELRGMVSRISRRDFNVELPKLEDDDTSKLGNAFKKMAGDLKDFYSQLESKVEERTRELSRKSEELQEAHDKAIAANREKDLEISQRQAAETRLKESELQYRTLVSNLPGIIFRCEPTPPFKMNFVSESFLSISGLDASELLSITDKGFSSIVVEEDKELLRQSMAQAVETGESFYLDFRYNRPDGKHGWFNLRGSPVNIDGLAMSIDCVAFDITEQREADSQIQQMREQQAEQRGKLEMSSSVLHDIGNAVTNVGTTVSQLVSENNWPENQQLSRFREYISKQKPGLEASLGQSKTEALVDFVHQLQKSFEQRSSSLNKTFVRLASIVQHVTEILHLQRRYSNSAHSNNRECIYVHDILNDALSIFTGSIEKRRIELECAFDDSATPIVGDRTRLLQVFNNILKNACEAIDARIANEPEAPRKICISVGKLDKTQLEVIVRDSGIGFSQEVSANFFKRGFTTKPNGSGIGIDQCHQILAAHGGEIIIESEGTHHGASVIVHFPTNKDMKPEDE